MTQQHEPTNAQQFQISVFSGLLFFLIANPATFKIVNRIIPGVLVNGQVSQFGLLVHTVVFILVVYGSMKVPIFN